MGEGGRRSSGYLDAADTRSTLAAVAALGAGIELVRRPSARAGRRDDRGRRAARRRARPRSTSATPAPCCGCCPGWLAGQEGGEWTLDGDESIRRRPVDRIAEPLAAMGAEVAVPRGRLPPLRRRRRRAARDLLRAAGRERPGQVVPAPRRPARRGRDRGGRARPDPRPHRADAERRRAAEVENAGAAERRRSCRAITVDPAERLALGEIAVPGDFSSAAFFLVAALLVPGSEVRLEDVGTQPDPDRAARRSSSGWAPRSRSRSRARTAGEPIGDDRCPAGALRGHPGRRRARCPLAIDELPLVALAGCFAEGETVVRARRSCGTRSRTGSRPWSRACARSAREIEATRGRLRGPGGGGLRGGTIDSHGDHRLAMLGAVAGLASREGVEVDGHGGGRGQLPGLRARPGAR